MYNSLTFYLIVLTCGISVFAWQYPRYLEAMTMNPYEITRRKSYWRLLTSGFIHADWGHLFFNMLSLFFFGLQLEYLFREIFAEFWVELYVLFYLLSIVAADLPTFFKHQRHANFNSLGASGAVSAVIFAGILFFPVEKIYLFGVIGIPGVIYAGLFTWYSIAMDRRGGDRINHSAHLYGALFGWLFISLSYPKAWLIFFQQIQSALW